MDILYVLYDAHDALIRHRIANDRTGSREGRQSRPRRSHAATDNNKNKIPIN
ncbi:hypothetical protein [Ancylobacter polymorphus]|jgi:hypothetical protein|uniref:Uncharacterized protein n=1 Tax=Ancylobacter polymorphus TaxID=223390 RepID=A0ABU0BEI4_9HYPH|nr:hypothetical protein [Ancylobacter polymorphus]MDQ0304024.1 hypothetical protein [Ancylobacter polymorphus]